MFVAGYPAVLIAEGTRAPLTGETTRPEGSMGKAWRSCARDGASCAPRASPVAMWGRAYAIAADFSAVTIGFLRVQVRALDELGTAGLPGAPWCRRCSARSGLRRGRFSGCQAPLGGVPV